MHDSPYLNTLEEDSVVERFSRLASHAESTGNWVLGLSHPLVENELPVIEHLLCAALLDTLHIFSNFGNKSAGKEGITSILQMRTRRLNKFHVLLRFSELSRPTLASS